MAHDLDGARTLERVLEVIAVRHPADVLVEVRGDGDPWRATGAELASAYKTNYRTPSPRTADGGDDPFFDFN